MSASQRSLTCQNIVPFSDTMSRVLHLISWPAAGTPCKHAVLDLLPQLQPGHIQLPFRSIRLTAGQAFSVGVKALGRGKLSDSNRGNEVTTSAPLRSC